MRRSNNSQPNESGESLRVSVVIPVFRGGKHFSACLASVVAALREQDELIVVANGEGDGAWRAALSQPARILRNDKNGGAAGGRNFGAAAATGDVLLFVDADVMVPADCVRKVARIFAEDQDLAALIGSYDEQPGERNFLSQFKNLFHHYVHQHGSPEASTFWGGCGAIRKEIFLDIGGFNAARAAMEDIELGYRLRAAAHRIRLVHDLQVTHWKRWETLNLLRSDLADRAAPWTELLLDQWIRQRHSVPSDLNLGLRYKLSLLTSWLFVAAIAASIFAGGALWSVVPLATLFLFLNLPLFRFFQTQRGWKFCLAAIPWRFLYDLCSGLGFVWGSMRFVRRTFFRTREFDDTSLKTRRINSTCRPMLNISCARETTLPGSV